MDPQNPIIQKPVESMPTPPPQMPRVLEKPQMIPPMPKASHTGGILWSAIVILLLLALVVYFFMMRRGSAPYQNPVDAGSAAASTSSTPPANPFDVQVNPFK